MRGHFGDAEEIVSRLREVNDDASKAELYNCLKLYLYPFLLKSIRDDHDAQNELHEIWVIVYRAVISGTIESPRNLFAYARGVAAKRINNYIKAQMQGRSRFVPINEGQDTCVKRMHVESVAQNPFETHTKSETDELIQQSLSALNARESEILDLFYIREHSEEEIRTAMDLTSTQYRLLKCRAKAKFAIIAKAKLSGRRTKLRIAIEDLQVAA